MRLVETLRRLDNAADRAGIINGLLEHFAQSYRRVAFLAVKTGEVRVWKVAGFTPASEGAALKLDQPSTLQDVVGTRMPYRGEIRDTPTTEFLRGVMGELAGESLAVPVTVRDRVVGIVLCQNRHRVVFHEHVSVINRATGDAFARILRARKRRDS